MMNLNIMTIILIVFTPKNSGTVELQALQSILTFFGGRDLTANNNTQIKDVSQMTPSELGQSRGVSSYNFVDFITKRYERECAPDDFSIAHLLSKLNDNAGVKLPIMVKCLPYLNASLNSNENSTGANKLQIIDNVKDVVSLLKPIGNTTKRTEEGSCVFIFFYTETSIGCSLVAPNANKLPRSFPTLRFAAIDAYKFPSFNTEFGIVGLPTLLLFHQGRPIVKFYSDEGSYASFVTRHTGIQAIKVIDEVIVGPLPVTPVQRTDYCLVLAWSFILLCLANYFAKSTMCQQIIEMIKRNWRESEAQLEHS